MGNVRFRSIWSGSQVLYLAVIWSVLNLSICCFRVHQVSEEMRWSYLVKVWYFVLVGLVLSTVVLSSFFQDHFYSIILPLVLCLVRMEIGCYAGNFFQLFFFWERNIGFVLQNLIECLVATGRWWPSERLCETFGWQVVWDALSDKSISWSKSWRGFELNRKFCLWGWSVGIIATNRLYSDLWSEIFCSCWVKH